MASGPSLSPEVAWVDAQLRAHPETVRIGHFAEAIGWGRSRLVDRFRREVGLPPKTVARVLRYREAVGGLTSGAASARRARRVPWLMWRRLRVRRPGAFQPRLPRLRSHDPTEFLASLG